MRSHFRRGKTDDHEQRHPQQPVRRQRPQPQAGAPPATIYVDLGSRFLDGVRIENNTFYWNPSIDAPVIQMDHADFTGTRPNIIEANTIWTGVSSAVHVNDALRTGTNKIGTAQKGINAACAQGGRFRIVATSAGRDQVVFLQAALAQYPGRIDAEIVLDKPPAGLEHDWHLDKVRLKPGSGREGVELFSPDGRSTARWDGFVAPAALGAALRGMLGVPGPRSRPLRRVGPRIVPGNIGSSAPACAPGEPAPGSQICFSSLYCSFCLRRTRRRPTCSRLAALVVTATRPEVPPKPRPRHESAGGGTIPEQLREYVQHGNPGAGMPAFAAFSAKDRHRSRNICATQRGNDLRPPVDSTRRSTGLNLNPATGSLTTAMTPANRYSPLKQITRRMSSSLKLKWVFPIDVLRPGDHTPRR